MATKDELLERFSNYAERVDACTSALEDAQEVVAEASGKMQQAAEAIQATIDGKVESAMQEAMADESSSVSGATAESDGSPGLVPAPAAGDQNKFLRGDGRWADVGAGDGKVYAMKMTSLPSTVPPSLADGGLLVIQPNN